MSSCGTLQLRSNRFAIHLYMYASLRHICLRGKEYAPMYGTQGASQWAKASL